MENDERQKYVRCPLLSTAQQWRSCESDCAWFCPAKQPKEGEPQGQCAIALIAHGLKGTARR